MWLAGDRTTSVLQLPVLLLDLRRLLKECLEGGYLDSLLWLSPSRCVFLVTKTHEVESWATTVREDSEESMRLGVYFSQASGTCVGFGWHGERERHSLPPSSRQNDSSTLKSAAFMSGFYIFRRDNQPPQVASAQLGAYTVSQGSSSDGTFKLDATTQGSSTGATGSQSGTADTRGSNVSSLSHYPILTCQRYPYRAIALPRWWLIGYLPYVTRRAAVSMNSRVR
jgi:hypothetical protein